MNATALVWSLQLRDVGPHRGETFRERPIFARPLDLLRHLHLGVFSTQLVSAHKCVADAGRTKGFTERAPKAKRSFHAAEDSTMKEWKDCPRCGSRMSVDPEGYCNAGCAVPKPKG